MAPKKMLREEILDCISRIPPHDAMEKDHLEFVKKWIGSGVEIFRTAKHATLDTHMVSYFIGPSDPSDPKDRSMQKIYMILFNDLTSHLCDLRGYQNKNSPFGYSYHGRVNIPRE